MGLKFQRLSHGLRRGALLYFALLAVWLLAGVPALKAFSQGPPANNGNTTRAGSVAYQYDVLNRLTNANNGAVLLTYDGDGNRVKKVVNGAITYYLVDDRNPSGYAQVVEEYQGDTANPSSPPILSMVYNYGLALISQRQITGGVVSYYGSDGHGSIRFLSDMSGNVTDTYTYDAYGRQMGVTGGTANNYRYCGEQWDGELGFYYLRARYYKPETGRFWTMDSFEGNSEDPASLHKYLYCHANPVNGWDPSGNEFELGSVLSAIGNGMRITAQMGVNTYSAYARAKWLKDSVEFISTSIATGTLDPVMFGLLVTDVLPIGKIAGTAGKIPGLNNLLSSLKDFSRAAKGKVGEMIANAVARGKGFMPTGFRPRGNGGFDGIFRDGNTFVVVEGKLGLKPQLNPGNSITGNPAQMGQKWIDKNIEKAARELETYDSQLAQELRAAQNAGRIKGMVIKTKVDAAGNITDAEFEIKEWAEIGKDAF